MQLENELRELFVRYSDVYTDFDGVDIQDVNQSGLGEDKLLHLACSYGDCQDVDILLRHGADVNAQGDIGLTALHYAASKGRMDVVRLLIKYGANLEIRNEFGETALDWARNNNQVGVVDLLNTLRSG